MEELAALSWIGSTWLWRTSTRGSWVTPTPLARPPTPRLTSRLCRCHGNGGAALALCHMTTHCSISLI